jgi:hypothetical protein
MLILNNIYIYTYSHQSRLNQSILHFSHDLPTYQALPAGFADDDFGFHYVEPEAADAPLAQRRETTEARPNIRGGGQGQVSRKVPWINDTTFQPKV